MKLLCKECGSTEVRNDRSLEGRLICAKCGSVDLEVSRGRLEFKLPNIKLEALRKTTQKQRAVIAASLIGVAAITAAIKSQDQQYCMDATDGSKVCIKKEGLSCLPKKNPTLWLEPIYSIEYIPCRGYGTIQDQAENKEHWTTEDELVASPTIQYEAGYAVCSITLKKDLDPRSSPREIGLRKYIFDAFGNNADIGSFFTCDAAEHFGLIEKRQP